MCVPVVKGTPCGGGDRGNHIHGGGVLKSWEHPLRAVVYSNAAGDICVAVGGGDRGVFPLRVMVVGAMLGIVVPAP